MTEVLKTSEMRRISRWSGSSISKTKDCETCGFFKNVVDDQGGSNQPEEGCLWGVAWKRLEATPNSRKCGKLNKSIEAIL